MGKLTSQQANELANYFLVMAQVVGEFREQNIDHLSKLQNKEIKDLQALLLKFSDDLYSLSATLVIDDVQTALSSIGEVINQMKNTYKSLQDVQKAIDIATSVVTLGEAIMGKNPKAITGAIGKIFDLWKA